MSGKHFNLGELEPLYNQYREIVANAPEGDVQVVYGPEQVADNINKINLHQIIADPSLDNLHELEAHIEAAKYGSISLRKQALVKSGFAGTLVALFEKIDDAILKTFHGENFNPAKIQKQIHKFETIDPKHRKGALLLSDDQNGYYFGGHLVRQSQVVVESKD